jgi:hypothetical protein
MSTTKEKPLEPFIVTVVQEALFDAVNQEELAWDDYMAAYLITAESPKAATDAEVVIAKSLNGSEREGRDGYVALYPFTRQDLEVFLAKVKQVCECSH